jgi:hypothetical protein
MKIVVYLGPSLSLEKARAILDADYRPPIRRGDLRKALRDGAGIICIIDGAFFTRSPVGHKEILAALKKGAVVVGGSSMGALRASELDVFGMVGVGRIYECYKNGLLVADDEVAVTYNPVTGEQMSEPLVNVRYQLKAAELDGVVTKEERAALVSMTAGMHYPDRAYPNIIKMAIDNKIVSSEKAAALSKYIKEKPLNLKAEDAVATLKKIKQISTQASPKSR